MLTKELSGTHYNKAEHNRNLQKLLKNRSRGAIEKKHQNISAVLIEFGYPYIDGYKPLPNFQRSLLPDVVQERLDYALNLHRATEAAVEKPAEAAPLVSDLLSIVVPPPVIEDEKPSMHDRPARAKKAVLRNYLEIEARNRSLGQAGEELVLRFEHERLWRAGKQGLADRIKHVAKTEGDGLGYDILSFETSGRERLIEVKTTRFGSMTPFFASRNELNISESREQEYQLYRLFGFNRQPQLFMLVGSLRQTCKLDPIQYSALPRSAT
jgi:hypothetical protein